MSSDKTLEEIRQKNEEKRILRDYGALTPERERNIEKQIDGLGYLYNHQRYLEQPSAYSLPEHPYDSEDH